MTFRIAKLRYDGTVLLLTTISLAAAGPLAVPLSAQQHEVLALYATRRDAQIAVVGDRELPLHLEQQFPGGVDYYSEYLDQARINQPTYQAAFSEFLQTKYAGHRFGVIIAMGEAPLRFLTEQRAGLFGDTPVVFFSDRPVARPPNSTGIQVELDLADTVALASALQPSARDVYVISGSTPNNASVLAIARRQFEPLESRLTFHYLTGLPTADLESRLRSISANSIVLYLVVDQDGAGVNVHPLNYIDRIVAASAAPVYCWVDSVLDRGIVGGSLKDQAAQARTMGALAARVLRGEAADQIPVIEPDLTVRQVNWRQLQRWGISEARVPAGTVILNREPTIWQRYWLYIVAAAAALLVESALIGGLLVQLRRRRRAEAQLALQQEQLQSSYNRIRDLGARLLTAQEEERARISRELHDDISQQIVLLTFDLEMLADELGGKAASVAESAVLRTRAIAKNVHDLSHRLHPARLQLLGLPGALRGLRNDLSNSNVEIEIDIDESLPQVTPELSLSLFRVVQEGLSNALKYSQGRHARVELRRTADGLRLTIRDDGVGFDVEGVARKGLGLISMRERVQAIGGTLDIRSRPGAGTELEVTVPLHHLKAAV